MIAAPLKDEHQGRAAKRARPTRGFDSISPGPFRALNLTLRDVLVICDKAAAIAECRMWRFGLRRDDVEAAAYLGMVKHAGAVNHGGNTVEYLAHRAASAAVRDFAMERGLRTRRCVVHGTVVDSYYRACRPLGRRKGVLAPPAETPREVPDLSGLNPTAAEVLGLMARGLTSRQAAASLGIPYSTAHGALTRARRVLAEAA